MQVTLKMWTPKGTMVEVTGEYDAKDAQELTHHVVTVEADMLRHGFTSQRPDHTYPTKEGVAEGVVVTDGNHWKTNEPQKVLNIYCKGTNLNFRDYTVFPESPVYPVIAAMVDLTNSVDQAPGRDKMQRFQKAWQPVNFRYVAKPAKYPDGSLVYRKKQDGTQKTHPEYEIVSVNGVSQASTNGNHAATNGAQGTRNAGATPNDTWEIKKLLEWGFDAGAFNAYDHARNRFFELVREELKAPQGGEYTALQAATDEVVANIKNLFISDAWNRINERADVSAQVGMDSEEGMPF